MSFISLILMGDQRDASFPNLERLVYHGVPCGPFPFDRCQHKLKSKLPRKPPEFAENDRWETWNPLGKLQLPSLTELYLDANVRVRPGDISAMVKCAPALQMMHLRLWDFQLGVQDWLDFPKFKKLESLQLELCESVGFMG